MKKLFNTLLIIALYEVTKSLVEKFIEKQSKLTAEQEFEKMLDEIEKGLFE
ncbi:hypothetical protein K0017_05135 [Staphylococcus massiliensis]|uniref:hypothetical protein n=1 Tax=Staphylococcus massiliensis TaxID=555791 RepID=UPI001EDDCCB4|nr:hypothetical protein [Staphylococcus massiliensis]MCG3401703.1 hypothetical protein [Staphylococcus massiliensis]